MPILLPVADSEYTSEEDMQDTLVEVRTWVREMGYYDVNMKICPGKGHGKFSVFIWEGANPKLKIAQNLNSRETIKFLNAWWSGFRYCNLNLKKRGMAPQEMPLSHTHMNKTGTRRTRPEQEEQDRNRTGGENEQRSQTCS